MKGYIELFRHVTNYELIKQNHLTNMIVSDHHEFTEVLHLNMVK